MANIEHMIKQANPSIAALWPFKTTKQGHWEMGFFIREDLEHLKLIPKIPRIHIRTGLLVYNHIPVMSIMVLIEENFDMLYEMFFNYHQPNGDRYLDDLISQGRILLHFYTATERIRTITVKNEIEDGLKEIKLKINQYPEWTMAEFDRAKERIYKDFSSPGALWEALGHRQGRV